MARKYRPRVIDAAFQKVQEISREEALKKVERKPSEKLTMVTTYDPRPPNMSAIVHKHFKTLTTNPHMREVVWKRGSGSLQEVPQHLEFLCRAKLYEKLDRRNPPRLTHKGL